MVSQRPRENQARFIQAGTTYPRIINLPSSGTRDKINSILKKVAYQAIPDYDPGTSVIQANSSYLITVVTNGILSVKFEDYYYPEMAAHGVTGVSSVTLDIRTAHIYKFEELFKKGSNYQAIIDRIIEEQIVTNQIPMLKPFEGVDRDTDYYLTMDSLVVFYQPYEYTPGYYGVLEFKILYTQINEIINPHGPIGRILMLT